MKACAHWFVVRDAFVVVTTYNANEFFWHAHLFLLYNFVVAYDAERYVWCNDRQLVDFVVGEEAVGNLDDAFVAHLFALQVVAYRGGRGELLEMEQTDDLEELCGWYVVDDCSVLESSHLEFLAFHLDTGFVVDDVIECDAKCVAKDGLACIEAIVCLLEVVGVWSVIDRVFNFVHTW